jgi:hypothetical protein
MTVRPVHFCSIEMFPDKKRHDAYTCTKGLQECKEKSVVCFHETFDEACQYIKAFYCDWLKTRYWFSPSRLDPEDFMIKIRTHDVDGFWMNEPSNIYDASFGPTF